MRAHGFSLITCQQDNVQANYRTTTPALHAIFEKEPDVFAQQPRARDEVTEAGLIAYVTESRKVDEGIHRIIDGIVASGKPIAVWGTGTHTLRLLATSRLADAEIRTFVDSNPKYQGKRLNGIPIISPADLGKGSPLSVLISSRVYQRDILRQLRDELEFQNEIITLYQE